MKSISNIVPFPVDAQSSPFFCALASVLLPVLDYTEETPFFCAPKGSFCVNCGNCANKTTLQKHHLQLYHDYQTFTGISLGWTWPEDDSEYNTMPGWGEPTPGPEWAEVSLRKKGWHWPDEFFSFIFGFAGLSWKRLSKDAGKDTVFAAIKASVDNGIPALMKLGTGPDWHVVTGYDENNTLYGLDSHNHYDHTLRPTREIIAPESYTDDGLFILPGWFDHFQHAVVITGRTEKTITFPNVLARLIQTLGHPAHANLEADLMAKLDGITPENVQETAEWLLRIVGFPIEARWHAADSSLNRQSDNKTVNDKLFGLIRQYVFDSEIDATHGTCWKIWAQLGVGPETGYALPPNAGELLLKPETRSELKRLFAIVFDNDRVVLKLLREASVLGE